MSNRQKIFIGGLGALTPIIMNLLIVDLSVTLENLKWGVLVGYIIRVLVLFYIGGIIAFLHKDENSSIKLCELGIAAPALIIAMINATNIGEHKIPKVAGKKAVSSTLFISQAYAQPSDKKVFSLPKETTFEQVKRGLFGSKTERVWFVIVGSHLKFEDAEKQAKQINNNMKGFNAEVYDKYGHNPYYGVVIGANLIYEEAQQLRKKAVDAGLPKDTYLWAVPR
jgi:hypothetical protein